jgi:hypothetical protein
MYFYLVFHGPCKPEAEDYFRKAEIKTKQNKTKKQLNLLGYKLRLGLQKQCACSLTSTNEVYFHLSNWGRFNSRYV